MNLEKKLSSVLNLLHVLWRQYCLLDKVYVDNTHLCLKRKEVVGQVQI